jgi:hypothetical protein
MGYLDALPTLERMASKLESRHNGRSVLDEMDDDEAELLAVIRSSLELLRAP